MKNPLDECLKKFVVIEADGIRFFGTLIEVGDEEAILRTENRWISVPVEKIAAVRAIDRAELEKLEIEDVDADEYVIAEVDLPEGAFEDAEESDEK